MSKIRRGFVLVAVGVVAGATVTLGVTAVVNAGAGGSSTTAPTWYACLTKAGGLTKAGTVAPTCSASQKAISWNSFPISANGTPQCTGIPHSGIDLSGCSLEGVYLANNYLFNSNFSGAYLLVSNFQESNLVDVNFAGANLGETTMSYADLNGANLTGTNLALANFNNANLTNANMTGATGLSPLQIGGVTWSNTTCPDGTNSSSYSPQTCDGHGI
jgi:hypothetical protein